MHESLATYLHVDVVEGAPHGLKNGRNTNILADAVAADRVVVRAVLGTTEPCLPYRQNMLVGAPKR